MRIPYLATVYYNMSFGKVIFLQCLEKKNINPEHLYMVHTSKGDNFQYEFPHSIFNQGKARDSKETFDIETIEKKLNTYVDFTGRKVSDELIDMFVERIIYRDNDEFVWEMNLSGVRKNTIDYRIKEYSEEFAKSLQNDDNFNILHTFIISTEECQQFMESSRVGRRFVKKYWKPITVKIAIK